MYLRGRNSSLVFPSQGLCYVVPGEMVHPQTAHPLLVFMLPTYIYPYYIHYLLAE